MAAGAAAGQAAGEGVEVSVGISEPQGEAAAEQGKTRAWVIAKEGALLGVESLKQEIQMLSALSVLQKRVLEWNTLLVESGVQPTSLEQDLCEEEALKVWCGILPASFGLFEEEG